MPGTRASAELLCPVEAADSLSCVHASVSEICCLLSAFCSLDVLGWWESPTARRRAPSVKLPRLGSCLAYLCSNELAWAILKESLGLQPLCH